MKKSDFDLYDMTFSFEGMSVSNPTLSSCGRFTVDPITEYGFSIIHTGGGCTALQKRVEGGWVVLCREVSHKLGDDLSPFIMGFYDGAEDDNTETMWGNCIGLVDLQVGVNVTTEEEINDLANDALNAMKNKVHSWLGVETDDPSLWLSENRFKALIKDYIRDEIEHKRKSYEKPWQGE